MRAVVFDLDGTLADTSGDMMAAANACFRAEGLGDLLGPEDAATALRGGRAMLREGFSKLGMAPDEDEISRLYLHLLAAYAEDLSTHTHFFPGAMEAVERLKLDGFAVAVCTNKPEALARQLLRDLGVLEAFGALIGADTLPVRKPDPEPLREAARRAGGDPARCCLVGDTVTDRETARAAGVPSILVEFGPAAALMAALEPEVLLAHFDDLPGVVAGLNL
ncbi:phosphoglycolate phosphatase [Pseudooceanicola antarcticus]|uniref:phosphoglycolate phosphatase n=1 Tax=Pseudooceanicola antarcticus TaxID=1247613 RepID=A0A285J2D9_9RHOB|nr:HAD-IA family hydrolase [Pseudooceanicola antarcticus]PJE29765.1 haloacid dehalogenase [Pseudooceanicola antarcticus]SNY54480.1 phosphoglycolate phosphatase [Pseudooceanicola antarcticus]